MADKSGPLSPDAIRAQLERVLKSAEFANAGRVKKLLAFVVEDTLAGKTDQLSEYALAFEVFGEAPDFDPGKNSIVRINARRLRLRLEAYYRGSGRDDDLIVDLSTGYVPQFSLKLKDTPHLPVVEAEPKRRPWLWMTMGALLLVAAFGWVFRQGRQTPSQTHNATESRPRRLFARSTSQGGHPTKILTGTRYGQLAVTPDGKKLYALSWADDRSITVLGAEDLQVKGTLQSPIPLRTATISRDHQLLYISSTEPQVVVIDTATDRVKRLIPVGAPTFDAIATADGRKLFLATGVAGLQRMDLVTGEIRVLSPLAHPTYLELDHREKQLFVAYNNGGPGGRAGHDVVDVYDVETERSRYRIGNLPMVNARPVLSPKDDVVLLDARDACTAPAYDHQGCGVVPSHPFHLFGQLDRRLVASVVLDGGGALGASLPEGTRALLLGRHLTMWDWAKRKTVERIPSPGSNWAAISPSGHRVFLSLQSGGILAFDAESEACLPPLGGLVNNYSADGTYDDAQGMGVLKNNQVDFAPGLVGQAFRFNGTSSSLWAPGGASYCPQCQSGWTEAFFVKFDGQQRAMTVLETAPERDVSARRVFRDRAHHVVLESNLWSDDSTTAIVSTDKLTDAHWYHLAVVTDHNQRSFYVDGKLQGRHGIVTPPNSSSAGPIYIGAKLGKRDFLRGLIDEYVIYNRALSANEVKSLASTYDCGIRR